MRTLAGRVALVTGASRGLGRYIARELADAGMHLGLAARSAGALEELAASMRSDGGRVVVLPTDLESDREIEALAEDAERELGAIDVLVNNAGITRMSHFHRLEDRELRREIRVNLIAPMLLTRRSLPGMLRRERGHVVNIASVAGKGGPPFDAGYGASKAGLISFTESLRQEYHGSGVSASVICPGYVEDAGMYHEMREAHGARARRLLGTSSPEAVAAAVVRAVRKDVPEIIVNRLPVRPLSTLAEASPRIGERLIRLVGAYEPFRRAAESGARREEGENERPAPPRRSDASP